MNPGKYPDEIPALVFADDQGNITDFPELSMAGAAANRFFALRPPELIPLPEGSELFVLPQRLPIGIDPKTEEPVLVDENPYEPTEGIQAVAAFMAPAHTAVYTAAYKTREDNAPLLPLFAYTAVGWYQGKFWVAAFRSDADVRQDTDHFDQEKINYQTQKLLKSKPDNRLIQHLGKCCLTYGCPAARNYFLGRWEAPLPTSPSCNASCVGCISLQPSGCCPSTQDRIRFIPTPREIADLAIPHLEKAPLPIVSFGQGCEGEPLLQAETIGKAIRQIRSKTFKGTINLNTNGSLPGAVEALVDCGLDSIRISMNSARKEMHRRYYRPRGFDFDDVRRSIAVMKDQKRFVSLNYFVLPGFTDDPNEYEALCGLIETLGPDLIQLRNLNMDPEWYLRTVGHEKGRAPLGILSWYSLLRKHFPSLKFGYYNPALS